MPDSSNNSSNSSSARDRIQKLRAEIDRLRYAYHVLNQPGVTDEIYTALRRELKDLEEKYPQYQTPGSPTERIAGRPLEKFKKTRHLFRQWSLDDAFNEDDLEKWEAKNLRILKKKQTVTPKLSYFAEPKIDGLHIVLTYQQGLLKTGATRGDGRIGEDVTQNLKTIESIPLKLKEPVDIVVEGECWLSKNELERINQERRQKQEPLFANPRNAAAGSIRQLDPKIAASRKLDCFVYDLHVIKSAGNPLTEPLSQAEELKTLTRLGFKVNQLSHRCDRLQEAEKFYQKIQRTKEKSAYGIDGLVIKVNEKKHQEALGYTGKAPRFAIAYKFPAEQTTTRIKAVEFQVGRTGALTPVAHLDPVTIAGSLVKRATLHNFDEIKRLDARIGDTVVIQKAGDIIPEIVEVIKNLRSGDEKPIKPPRQCPQCRGRVGRRRLAPASKRQPDQYEVAYYCLNPRCFSIQKRQVIHFVSKKAFNIEGLGIKIIEQLMEAGLVKDAADIFTLQEDDLLPLPLFKEKKSQKIIQAIQAAKTIDLSRFIYALGIRHVGEEMARLLAVYLARSFRKTGKSISVSVFNKTLAALSAQELASIEGAGEKISVSIQEYLTAKRNQELLAKLNRVGLSLILPIPSPAANSAAANPAAGKTFVLTGTLPSLSRDQAQEKIRTAGGQVTSSISKNTDYLVVGENPGSKLAKARKLGIKIIQEKELEKMLS